MKEPKEFKTQLPPIVASAFKQRGEPVPSDEVVHQLVAAAIALLEQAAGGQPVVSMAPLVVVDKLVSQIVAVKPHVAKALKDSGQPVPPEVVLLDICARQVLSAVAGGVGTHGAELALLLKNSQILDG